MNVSLSNLNKQYQVHYQRSAIDTFTRQQTMQNGMIDLYVRGNNSVAYSEIYSSFASEKIVIFLICCCWLSIMTALRYENMEKHMKLQVFDLQQTRFLK